jgi:hypothetical protein
VNHRLDAVRRPAANRRWTAAKPPAGSNWRNEGPPIPTR